MAKNSVRDFDATAANNTDIQSVDIAENCAPSGINNAIRELMADIKDVSTGTIALESPQADSMTVAGDLTVDTNTLYVDSTNNAVGVGTVSPDGKIHAFSGDASQTANSSANQLVAENSGNAGLSILSGSTSLGNVYFADSGSTTAGFIQYEHGNNNLRFGTDSSESMRIDSSGNLLIGTSSTASSSAVKTLFSNTTGGTYLQTNSGSNGGAVWGTDGGGSAVFFTYTGGIGSESYSERLRIDGSGNVMAGVTSTDAKLYVTNGASPQSRLIVGGGGGAANTLYTILSGGNNIQFETNGAERMRIDTSGNLLVGTTTVNGIGFSLKTDAFGRTIDSNTSFSGGFSHNIFRYNGTVVGSITTSSVSTSYNTSSDYRLKEDMQPMTGAIERVNALNPVNFAWKEGGSRTDGFLAHEAQAVVPEAVTGTKDAVDADGNPDYQGIDQSKLVPLLTAALQEAITKIETLEAKVTALENA